MRKVVKEGPLHKTHHILFWALDELAKDMASSVSLFDEEEILRVWKALIDCMETAVPHLHQEKAVVYDQFAQVTDAFALRPWTSVVATF